MLAVRRRAAPAAFPSRSDSKAISTGPAWPACNSLQARPLVTVGQDGGLLTERPAGLTQRVPAHTQHQHRLRHPGQVETACSAACVIRPPPRRCAARRRRRRWTRHLDACSGEAGADASRASRPEGPGAAGVRDDSSAPTLSGTYGSVGSSPRARGGTRGSLRPCRPVDVPPDVPPGAVRLPVHPDDAYLPITSRASAPPGRRPPCPLCPQDQTRQRAEQRPIAAPRHGAPRAASRANSLPCRTAASSGRYSRSQAATSPGTPEKTRRRAPADRPCWRPAQQRCTDRRPVRSADHRRGMACQQWPRRRALACAIKSRPYEARARLSARPRPPIRHIGGLWGDAQPTATGDHQQTQPRVRHAGLSLRPRREGAPVRREPADGWVTPCSACRCQDYQLLTGIGSSRRRRSGRRARHRQVLVCGRRPRAGPRRDGARPAAGPARTPRWRTSAPAMTAPGRPRPRCPGGPGRRS